MPSGVACRHANLDTMYFVRKKSYETETKMAQLGAHFRSEDTPWPSSRTPPVCSSHAARNAVPSPASARPRHMPGHILLRGPQARRGHSTARKLSESAASLGARSSPGGTAHSHSADKKLRRACPDQRAEAPTKEETRPIHISVRKLLAISAGERFSERSQ